MTSIETASGGARVLDVEERPSPHVWIVLSLQHLFAMFGATIGVGDWWGYSIAIIAAVNAVIAFVYYSKVVKVTWFDPLPASLDLEDQEGFEVPAPIGFALGLTAVGVIVIGFFPGLAANIGEYSTEIFAYLGL